MSSPEQSNLPLADSPVSFRRSSNTARPWRNLFSFANGLLIPDVSSSTVFIDNRTEPCQRFEGVECTNYAGVPWSEIPTPTLDSIVYHQYGEDCKNYNEIYEMFLMCIGRMLYPPGEHENWEFLTFFLGCGGSGKSTVVRDIVGAFYSDRHTINLRGEEPQLALARRPDAYVTLMPECSRDTYNPRRVPLVQMITGDEMAEVDKWPTHVMGAGNEFPDLWKTSEMSRRMVIFNFNKRITAPDVKMHEKLQAEMPAIIQKCSRVYRHKAMVHGDQSVFDFAPIQIRNAAWNVLVGSKSSP